MPFAGLGNAADQTGRVGGSVTSVTLNASADNKHLSLLREFPILRFLTIDSSQITDDGLAYLKDSKQLIHIEIKDTPISGEGLRHLASIYLSSLFLWQWQEVDPGLLQLNELPSRVHVYLDLSETDIKDADAVCLPAEA